MRNICLLVAFSIIILSCKEEKKSTLEEVISKYNRNIDKVDKVSYSVRKIDTFSKETIWDKNGFALIEKKTNDSIFGFSYYGKNLANNRTSIYSNYNHFNIVEKTKEFEQEPAGYYIVGSPGGQMIYTDIFKINEKNIVDKNLKETDDSFILTFILKDLEQFNIVRRKRIIELDKETFMIKKSHNYSFSEINNYKKTSTFIFSDIKINSQVKDKVEDYVSKLVDYQQILPEEEVPNKLLGKQLPKVELSNLLTKKAVKLKDDKLLLIDFWEVWCGYCIKSFPEVERLANTYEGLKVVGIVTENKDKAIRLVNKKSITFTNLWGTKELLKEFSVNSFPRYFLVDKNGIIQKEYHGFSEEIEKDIKALL